MKGARRLTLRVCIITGATALLLVGLLAITGGLRLRTPVNDMHAAIERFELLPDEEVVSLTTTRDAICFLQCAAWKVKLEISREHRKSLDGECQSFSERLASWSGSVVDRLEPRIPDQQHCTLRLVDSSFGTEWSVVGGVDLHGDDVSTWTLILSAP